MPLSVGAWTIWSRPHGSPSNLRESDLVVVDATMFMPGSGRDARAEYAEAHIPGARFLDIDELSDRSAPTPHMLPPADQFGAAMEELGIGRGDRIVVYDNSPLRTAARGWFMLRHYGAERVAILDGGLAKWRDEGRPVESGDPRPREARFDAEPRARRSRRQVRRPQRARRPADRCPRPRPVRRQRARSARRGRAGPHPGIAQPAVRDALQRRRHLQARGGIARGVRRRRRRSRAPVRRQLRIGGHRQFADLRRAICSATATRGFTMEAGANGAPIPDTPKDRLLGQR